MAKLFFFSYPSKERNGGEEKEHPHSIFGSASHYGVNEIINVENWTGEEPKRIKKKNVFCCGHSFLDNGDLFVFGGGQYQTKQNYILYYNIEHNYLNGYTPS